MDLQKLEELPVIDVLKVLVQTGMARWICDLTSVEDLRRREQPPRFRAQLLVSQAAFRS
jgi:hypothetical protein